MQARVHCGARHVAARAVEAPPAAPTGKKSGMTLSEGGAGKRVMIVGAPPPSTPLRYRACRHAGD